MPELPWMKWYPQDWLSDPALTMCSPASRGIWADALFAMKLNKTPSLSGNLAVLSRLCRCSESEMQAAVEEIEHNNVAIVTNQNGSITLTNRRFKREHDISEIRRKAGASSKQKGSKEEANTPASSVYASASSCSASGKEGESEGAVDYSLVGERWNTLAANVGARQIRTLSESRKRKYQLRLKEWPEFWETIEKELPLLGTFALESPWFDFGWLIHSDANFEKFAEGKYRRA